eukprot:gene11928-13896_t
MNSTTIVSLILMMGIIGTQAQFTNVTCTQPATSFYDLSGTFLNGTKVHFSQFEGKFGEGFPCGQFMNQEPGSNADILNCLKYVRPGEGFEPAFPLFQKTIINGDGTDPIFLWLKSGCPNTTPEVLATKYISWTPVLYNDITWNFEKFLVSKTGQLMRRYSPETLPPLLVDDISALLNA